MYCAERQRFFEAYYDSVSAFSAALTTIDRFWVWHLAERRKPLQAEIETESARLALEKHEQEHGCVNSLVAGGVADLAHRAAHLLNAVRCPDLGMRE